MYTVHCTLGLCHTEGMSCYIYVECTYLEKLVLSSLDTEASRPGISRCSVPGQLAAVNDLDLKRLGVAEYHCQRSPLLRLSHLLPSSDPGPRLYETTCRKDPRFLSDRPNL